MIKLIPLLFIPQEVIGGINDYFVRAYIRANMPTTTNAMLFLDNVEQLVRILDIANKFKDSEYYSDYLIQYLILFYNLKNRDVHMSISIDNILPRDYISHLSKGEFDKAEESKLNNRTNGKRITIAQVVRFAEENKDKDTYMFIDIKSLHKLRTILESAGYKAEIPKELYEDYTESIYDLIRRFGEIDTLPANKETLKEFELIFRQLTENYYILQIVRQMNI
jgi:hypothetical protein